MIKYPKPMKIVMVLQGINGVELIENIEKHLAIAKESLIKQIERNNRIK